MGRRSSVTALGRGMVRRLLPAGWVVMGGYGGGGWSLLALGLLMGWGARVGAVWVHTRSWFCTHINTFTCRLNHVLLQVSGNRHGHFPRSSLVHFSEEPSRAGACLKSLSRVQHFHDPIDRSPPGSSVRGILQARVLEWVGISSSRGSSRPRDWACISCIGRWILCHRAIREDCGQVLVGPFCRWNVVKAGEVYSPTFISWCMHAQSLSCVWLFATPWTVAHHASLSMGFSRQEYWSRLQFLSLGDLPNSEIEPTSP